MKYIKIDTEKENIKIDKYAPTITVKDHTMIGLTKSKDGKTASMMYILRSEIESKETCIGLKVSYTIDDNTDLDYIDNIATFNFNKMDDSYKEHAREILRNIDINDMWYSDLCPVKWEDDYVTIKGYHYIEKVHYEVDIKLPISVYLFLSKVHSDMITCIPTNPYYTFTDLDFNYHLYHLDQIEYLGSDTSDSNDESNNVLSMYHATGDQDLYITVPFNTDETVNVRKDLSFDDFIKEHPTFFNLDIMSFFYYTDPRKNSIVPALIVYDSENKAYNIYNLSDDVFVALFNPDREVSKDEANSGE